ncbi:MAG: ribonuclease HII [bacterium]|nr:ribonuclease HII [bacterium]
MSSRQLRLQFPHRAQPKKKQLPNCAKVNPTKFQHSRASLGKPNFEFEQQLYTEGYTQIAGLDEAGRGPLAGPVVAAAVIFPQYCEIAEVNDSKRLTALQRTTLYSKIIEQAISVGVGIVPENIIDEINILQASIRAMQLAIENLTIQPDSLLIDAITLPDCSLPQRGIIKGDQKSISIAAASIIAKVVRDTLMQEYHRQYPEYGFAQHKGYATPQHISAIRQFGLCQIHRRTFVTHCLS